MADLDFITDLTGGGFKISLTDNPQKVTGNRALLNRFEITFLTKAKAYLLGETPVIDVFGGNADALITQPQVINNGNAVAAAISMCIDRTVKSMTQDQSESIPDNEKIINAELLNMYIQNDMIFATIKVNPVQTDSYDTLVSNLPVIKR
jgi:hypothetical protein